jgi:anti-anti-sigma regulatory factor
MAGEQVVVVRRRLDAAALDAVVGRGAAVTVDLAALTDVDLATVDALARLHLTATRAGGRLRLRNVPPPLAELLALAGLTAVLTA